MEEGRYRARGIQGALGETKGGAEQVAVEFEFLDEPVKGQRITWFGYFTDKTTEHTVKALRTCGWQGADLTDLSGVDANEVILVIQNEEYEGTWRSKVRFINSLNGGLALKNPLDENKARAFAARMKGQILAIDQSSGQRRAPASTSSSSRSRVGGVVSPEPPPPGEADDIPF